MDRKLRRLTPLVLLLLAAAVLAEPYLPERVTTMLGAGTVTRFAVAVLCLYTVALIAERERMAEDFKGVLRAFQDFHRQQSGAQSGSAGVPESQRREAIDILISALESQDAGVRDKAHAHLRRITWQELPADPAQWRAWVARG